METIAIIEDDQITQHVLKDTLIKKGFNVEQYFNGDNLLEKLSKSSANLIITDILLPCISGFDLIKVYQNIQTPIIVTSSMHEDDVFYFSKTIGAISFLKKPFTNNNLLEIINNKSH